MRSSLGAAGNTRQAAGHDALGASLKDASCERSWATVADMRAQVLIVDALRLTFPGITIVGEEDEDDAEEEVEWVLDDPPEEELSDASSEPAPLSDDDLLVF